MTKRNQQGDEELSARDLVRLPEVADPLGQLFWQLGRYLRGVPARDERPEEGPDFADDELGTAIDDLIEKSDEYQSDVVLPLMEWAAEAPLEEVLAKRQELLLPIVDALRSMTTDLTALLWQDELWYTMYDYCETEPDSAKALLISLRQEWESQQDDGQRSRASYVGTYTRVRKAHALIKGGEFTTTACKKVGTDTRTYYEHCPDATGEEPIITRRRS